MRASFLSRVPGARRHFRYFAPLYPFVFERFDLRDYDVIVSSSSAWAKGVRVRDGAVHVCYLHTVSRFLFAYDAYVGGLGAGRIARPIIAGLAAWDRRAAARPTRYVANSATTAARIAQYYGRSADILHPPVDVERFRVGDGGGGYFLMVARLLPYKRADLAIAAAKSAGVPLVIAGTGPMERSLREAARGADVVFAGFVDDARMPQLYANARAVIVPGEEDFGLVALEAAAAGRPTIAYRGGGALETVIDGVTGLFFDRAEPDALAELLRTFEERAFDPMRLREHAERFSVARFVERLRSIVERTALEHGIPC